MKRIPAIAAIVLIIAVLSSCAPGANTEAVPGGEAPGFWPGLWHGFISLFTFIISLFNENVGVYEIHNSGGWYDFGFLVGVMMFWGGGCGGTACRRNRGRSRT